MSLKDDDIIRLIENFKFDAGPVAVERSAIAASRSFMRKPACRSLACALSDATISSTFYIGHCRRNDGFRSAPSDA